MRSATLLPTFQLKGREEIQFYGFRIKLNERFSLDNLKISVNFSPSFPLSLLENANKKPPIKPFVPDNDDSFGFDIAISTREGN